jgi:clan AA aspartic protease (TIGR02281 family)
MNIGRARQILRVICITIILIYAIRFAFFPTLKNDQVIGSSKSSPGKITLMSKERSNQIIAMWKQMASEQSQQPMQSQNPVEQAVQSKTPDQHQEVIPGSIYKYTDESGLIVMVDNLEKVPQKYRNKMQVSGGAYGQQRTTVKVIYNQIWVPVTLTHRGRSVSTWLLLDTGATDTSISPTLAQRLGIQPAETIGGRATLADGRVVQTAHIVVDQVTVGPKSKQSVNVQIMPRTNEEETGLLGMNFLGDFAHIIETRASIIRWQ